MLFFHRRLKFEEETQQEITGRIIFNPMMKMIFEWIEMDALQLLHML